MATSVNGVYVFRLGSLAFASSEAWISGSKSLLFPLEQETSCASPELMVVVRWRAFFKISQAEALHACHLALQSAHYILRFGKRESIPILPNIYLAATGEHAEIMNYSFYPFGPLEPVFITRWHDSQRHREADIVDLISHELFHMLTLLAKTRDPPNELLARQVGGCAQLEVNGGIALQSVAIIPTPDETPLPDNIRASWGAGEAYLAEVISSFDQFGWLPADSKAGRGLRQDCVRKLRRWFEGQQP